MGKTIVALEDKEPYEIVAYQFDLSKNTAFQGTNAETISSVAFMVYLDSEEPESATAITAMVGDSSFSGTVIQSNIGSGDDDEGTYILRARIVCSSGRRYEEQGRFKVVEVG